MALQQKRHPKVPFSFAGRRLQNLLQLFLKLRYCFKQIRNQAVISNLEDRRFFILVDRNDHLGIRHTGQVLDGTGDADCDVQLRRNDLAGLANLHVVRYETCVNRGAGCTNGSAHQVSNLLQHLEVVAVLHAAATGDNDTGRSQIRTVRLGFLFTNEGRQAGVFYNVQLLNRSGTTFGSYRVETGRAYRDNLDGVARLDSGDGVTRVDRTNKRVLGFNAHDVRHLSNVQQRSNARHEVFTGSTGSRQDVAVAFTDFGHQLAQVLGQEMTVNSVVGNQYLVHAFCLGSGFSDGAYVLTGNQHVDVTTDGLGSRYNIQGSLLEAAVVVFSNYQDAHLDHLRFVLQFVHQLSYVSHLDTSLACSRGFDLQGGQARGDFNTQIGGAHGVQRLLLGLHDVRQRSIARLVQTQVSGNNRRQVQSNSHQTAVYFAGYVNLFAINNHFRSESALAHASQSGQHLASLVVVGIDGLLAKNNQLRLFFLNNSLQQLGRFEGLNFFVSLDVDTTVSTQSQSSTDLLLSSFRSNGYNNDFTGNALLFQTNRFFHSDFAERVHCHLDVGEVNTGVVRLDAHLHVVVDNSFYSDQNLHRFLVLLRWV